MITYTIAQKTREIGIRKVIGAGAGSIVMLFYKQYFRLVIIANVIALPLAWYFMNGWLNDFPYRVNISWWVFVVAGLLAVVIALVTVSFQAMKAALANPVKSLRAE